jgi:hypothetical protein
MKLHHRLWVEAMAITKYMQNQIPTNGIFYKSNFVCFGCVAFAHMLKKTKTKLDSKGVKCIFIDYCEKN